MLPFGFAFNAALLMEGDAQTVVISVICATIGAIFLSAAFAGFLFGRLGLANRTVCFIGSALCFLPPSMLSVLGLVLVVMAALVNRYADQRLTLIS